MKIFIGTDEIAGIIYNLSRALENQGHQVSTWVKNRNHFYQDAVYTHDLSYLEQPSNELVKKLLSNRIGGGIYRRARELYNRPIREKSFKGLLDCDLYIYMWGTALRNYSDLKLLKERGKNIVFLFVGSDARYHHAFNQEFPEIKLPWSPFQQKESLNKKIEFIRAVEKYADAIFSVPDQAGLQIRPYWHVYMPFELEKYPFAPPDNTVPRILHAPSNPAGKGTPQIEAALNQLKSEGVEFEYTRLTGVSNETVQQYLNSADIVADQIFNHGPGMLGTEAMAVGCAVAVKYLRGYEQVFNPPVCYIDTETLADNLRKLITDRDYRKDLVVRGRSFVEQYNDSMAAAKRILDIVQNPGLKPDYSPLFFTEKFMVPADQQLNGSVKKLNEEMVHQYYRGHISEASLRERGII